MELISALLIGLFVFLLLMIVFVGVVFHGVGYDQGLEAGLRLSDYKNAKPKRNLKIKPELKIKDLDHGGYLK